jgi:hypothetical protein
MYHNNPAVPATFAILASLLVMGVGTVATGRRVRLASEAPVVDAGEARPVGGGRRS